MSNILNSFIQLGISSDINQALIDVNIIEATQIQKEVIPLVLSGKDILAQAQTGSGKSASFVLPILEYLSKNIREGKPKIRVMVLTPTRELTLQVGASFKTFSSNLEKKIKIVSVIGGESLGDQLFDIQQGCDIVVATSGRLLDVISKKQMNLSHLEFLVIDEADKMLNLGFSDELDLILKELPKTRQNLMFSATYPQKILDIAAKVTINPTRVTIKQELVTTNINQRVIEVNSENRGPLLRELLDTHEWDRVLVFMANKRASDNIATKFRKRGYKAESFHGDLDQSERNLTLDEFKNKKIHVLFATDIASRGLHIDDISAVINFDLPRSPDDYVHRIGRTARAGKVGVSISFVGLEDYEHFALIEKRCKLDIKKEQIAGFELVGEVSKKKKGLPPVKGKRKSKKDRARELAKKDK
jgi:superfamily II DNA/RNA helicase